ncbi:MAG: hypothetical protein ACRCV9_19555 [Burkholderiaceae bacterium]
MIESKDTKQYTSDLSLGERVYLIVAGALASVCFAASVGFVGRWLGWS